jgi:hypothetical protein
MKWAPLINRARKATVTFIMSATPPVRTWCIYVKIDIYIGLKPSASQGDLDHPIYCSVVVTFVFLLTVILVAIITNVSVVIVVFLATVLTLICVVFFSSNIP